MEVFQEFDPSFSQKIRNARIYSEERGTRWSRYGEPIDDYDSYFSSVLHGKRIVDLLKAKKEPVVVDLMAPSATIVDLFNHLPQPQKHGIALSYEDLRTNEEKQRDSRMNIQQLQGDVLTSSTWKRLENSLDGRKADLVMERALGGLICIPVHKDFYAYAVSKMWNMLSDQEGVLLIQTPGIDKLESVDVFVPEWVEQLNESGIKAESYSLANLISKALIDKMPLIKGIPSCNALKLIKSKDSPRVLPAPVY
jgi:hypothetical protein